MRRAAELPALAGVLLLGAVLRLGAPGADVPIYPGSDYSPVQDAFWYLESAASAAEGITAPAGGPSDPEPEYDPPVWTSLARVWLQVAGSSRESACLLGGVVGLAVVLLTWRLARAALGPGPALASAAVLAALHPHVLESRAPQVYGPVTVGSLLAAAVWLHGRGRGPGGRAGCELAAWAIVLALALAVRPPAAALVGGLFLGTLVRAPRLLPWALGALALGAAWLAVASARGASPFEPLLAALSLFDPERAVTLRYRLDNYGGAAAPSFALLALRALRFGGPPVPGSGSGFLALDPGACAVAALGLALVLTRWSRLRPAARETLALLLGAGAALFLGSLLMDRRPLRYFALAAPALAVCAGCAVAWTFSGANPAARSGSRAPWPVLLGLALLGGLGGAHALELAFLELGLSGPRPLGQLGLAAGAGGLVLAGSARLPGGPAWSPALRQQLAVGLLLLACGFGWARGAALLLFPTRVTTVANRTFTRIVAPGGTVCGPYASPLAIGSGLRRRRGTWLLPGEALGGTLARLREERVTHLVLDVVQERGVDLIAACRARGVVLEPVAVLLIAQPPPHGMPLLVLRLPWCEEVGYRPSGYETSQARDGGADPPTEADPQLLAARLRTLALKGGDGHDLLRRSLSAHRDLGRFTPLLEAALTGR